MLPTRDFSLGGRTMSFYTPEPVPEPVPEPTTQSPPSVEPIHAGNSWRSHVKEVYSMLKSVDPSTTLREAMTHAKASYQSKKSSK
jgi:hypothetical protein